jgi:CHASE2 domain-containing sensor protein
MLFELFPLQSLEYKIYDLLSHLRRSPPAKSVVIVAIDDKSLDAIGDWPWPRSYIADMVRKLSKYRAHTLGLAILFREKELNDGLKEIQNIRESLLKKPLIAKRQTLNKIDTLLANSESRLDHDERLISAVRLARNVVLPLRFDLTSSNSKNAHPISAWLKMNSIAYNSNQAQFKTPSMAAAPLSNMLQDENLVAKQIYQPYLELSRKSGALGHINLVADPDGKIREIPLLIQYQSRGFLSFALQVSMKYFGAGTRDVQLDSYGLLMKHLRVPTGGNYCMMIDYSGHAINIQKFSFIDVIDDKIPAKAFRNKIILVGLAAKQFASGYKTPLHTDISGIEITAQAVENLVNNKHVTRPAWSLTFEIMVLIYFGFFLLFVIPKVKPRVGILILGISLISWIGIAGLLFMAQGYVLRVSAPIILCVFGFALTGRKSLAEEKHDESIELNKSLGLSLQGQGMLDMAFEKFMKCPIEDKSVKALLYNLGLDFERKRMFNKALAVYNHILKAGAFKDIKNRITNLKQIEKSVVLPAGATKKDTSLLLENVSTKPTLGRYEIIKELGRGAMGTVYLGKDPNINREVAIKTLNYGDVEPQQLNQLKSQFFREAEAAGKLSHPNIVTIYDVGEDHDMAYIAMELLKGKDLKNYCQAGNLLPFESVLNVAVSVAEALDYAHQQGVIHRDIKPANIILLENDQVKVADFGIARFVSSSTTQTGIIFGTPNYMSPEQVAGEKVDGRSDLFSLGVVLFELLSGDKPFKGDSIAALMYAITNMAHPPLAEVAPDTPECCVKIVTKLLTKGVTKRYKSAALVVKHLQECREQLNKSEKGAATGLKK